MYCGNEFIAKTTVTKYCGNKCNSKDYKNKIKALKVYVANNETKKIIPQHIKNRELNEKITLSISDLGELIGISRSTINRLLNEKKLTRIYVKSRVFITRSEVKNVFKI